MDSLLRQFDPGSRHSLFSPLFLPDPDQLERTAEQVGPKADTDLARMGETQSIAQQNLAHYVAADHLDLYVATSMRSEADFVSVNRFVNALFQHDVIRPLKLRFFKSHRGTSSNNRRASTANSPDGKWTCPSKYGRSCSRAHSRISCSSRSGRPSLSDRPRFCSCRNSCYSRFRSCSRRTRRISGPSCWSPRRASSWR